MPILQMAARLALAVSTSIAVTVITKRRQRGPGRLDRGRRRRRCHPAHRLPGHCGSRRGWARRRPPGRQHSPGRRAPYPDTAGRQPRQPAGQAGAPGARRPTRDLAELFSVSMPTVYRTLDRQQSPWRTVLPPAGVDPQVPVPTRASAREKTQQIGYGVSGSSFTAPMGSGSLSTLRTTSRRMSILSGLRGERRSTCLDRTIARRWWMFSVSGGRICGACLRR